MPSAHLRCLSLGGTGGDELRADACGADHAPTVVFAPPFAPSTARLVPQLRHDDGSWSADLDADGWEEQCLATPGGLACGGGPWRAVSAEPTLWSYSRGGMPELLAQDPATFAVGDLDGDGRADLCELVGDRVLCARSHATAFGPRTATWAIVPAGIAPTALHLADDDGHAAPCLDTPAGRLCAER